MSSNQANVILVGCGCPLRGMGWYHAVQLLENQCPSGKLIAIVEPWFLGAGADGEQGQAFKVWKEEMEGKHEGLGFYASLGSVPKTPTLALISGRTASNPGLLTECIAHGCSVVYLEKPGAPTVAELEAMKEEALANKVSVLMGYNKNVCKYVSNVRDYASQNPGLVTFVSNNAYENTKESLGECFERNCEGMLKNMAIHELALLVSFYDVTVSNIESVVADKSFSSVQTLPGPSGKSHTDFDKIKFTITTKTGKTVAVQADRCGGDVSYATVSNDSVETYRHSMPDEHDIENVKLLEKKYPGAMPYFFSQDPDYVTVKERVSNFCLTGKEAEGVATIDVAVETLRVAEYLVEVLKEQLKE
ncbi:hypothetical protein TrLO_g10431 [Triparma laevis f. longispina]|uniref:Gfo/Idh/MocA-like oxidoreductase N-terminal domain-containing protein n=1 Tax=Triparma laevis f. longispina TaxID=1714387 RepID=A0A9W7CCC9_9STRA|nr:hypothetical protein TrLO_g10431 [Triparma laevis f. longispina]